MGPLHCVTVTYTSALLVHRSDSHAPQDGTYLYVPETQPHGAQTTVTATRLSPVCCLCHRAICLRLLHECASHDASLHDPVCLSVRLCHGPGCLRQACLRVTRAHVPLRRPCHTRAPQCHSLCGSQAGACVCAELVRVCGACARVRTCARTRCECRRARRRGGRRGSRTLTSARRAGRAVAAPLKAGGAGGERRLGSAPAPVPATLPPTMSGTRASNDRSSHPGGGGVKRARSEPGGNKVTVVLGAQWGDEGKGKVVDLLATESDIVCRCQVGAGPALPAGPLPCVSCSPRPPL